jgi:hypothetical protein
MAIGESDQQLFWPYLNCAKSERANMICKSWVVCFQCGKKGNVKRHCSAQWKSSNRKILIETNKAWAGLRSNISGEPSSKPPPTKTKDPPNLTQTLRDSSHTPSVELCLGVAHQNSSVPQKSRQSDLAVAQQQHSSPSSSFSPSTT